MRLFFLLSAGLITLIALAGCADHYDHDRYGYYDEGYAVPAGGHFYYDNDYRQNWWRPHHRDWYDKRDDLGWRDRGDEGRGRIERRAYEYRDRSDHQRRSDFHERSTNRR